MNSKFAIWAGMIIGSAIGSIMPSIWGADMLSFSSIIFSAIGGIAGILVAYKLSS